MQSVAVEIIIEHTFIPLCWSDGGTLGGCSSGGPVQLLISTCLPEMVGTTKSLRPGYDLLGRWMVGM